MSFSVHRRLTKSPTNWPKQILYADRVAVVLNKPSGLVCQTERSGDAPSRGNASKFRECLNSIQRKLSLSSTPYPVHRLDKGTTGVLLLAKTLQSAQSLSQQFRQGTVEKTYLALVRGGDKSFPVKSGKISAPLQYHDGRVSLDSSRRGKPSLTEWDVVASSPIVPLSLLRLRLLTGHKHQLRVHLAQCLKTPILGDVLYSNTTPSGDIIELTSTVLTDRIYLHAHDISFFRYRTSGPHKRFRLAVCAPIPRDFVRICMDAQINLGSLCVKGGVFVNGVQEGNIPQVDGYWYKSLEFEESNNYLSNT